MKILHLNVKKCFFEEFQKGLKNFEYRLVNDYWRKRLENVHYDEIRYKCGYPKNEDISKIIKIPYTGFEIQEIFHEHFGSEKVLVFAIKLKG